jgi:hypothetical protein
VVILLVGTQFIKLDCLMVVLNCFTQALFETKAKVVLGTGTVSCLSKEIHCFFIIF